MILYFWKNHRRLGNLEDHIRTAPVTEPVRTVVEFYPQRAGQGLSAIPVMPGYSLPTVPFREVAVSDKFLRQISQIQLVEYHLPRELKRAEENGLTQPYLFTCPVCREVSLLYHDSKDNRVSRRMWFDGEKGIDDGPEDQCVLIQGDSTYVVRSDLVWEFQEICKSCDVGLDSFSDGHADGILQEYENGQEVSSMVFHTAGVGKIQKYRNKRGPSPEFLSFAQGLLTDGCWWQASYEGFSGLHDTKKVVGDFVRVVSGFSCFGATTIHDFIEGLPQRVFLVSTTTSNCINTNKDLFVHRNDASAVAERAIAAGLHGFDSRAGELIVASVAEVSEQTNQS